MRTIVYTLVFAGIALAALALWIAGADYPRLRLQRLVFQLLPIGQRALGLTRPSPAAPLHGFRFEHPDALQALREDYGLDAVVAAGATDFERWTLLMHWARDRFPHGRNSQAPDVQAFDGVALLAGRRGNDGFLCGMIAPLLVQAVTAMGGYARRVNLRVTPSDSHAVTEVWSQHYGKWLVLDPDYDVFFTVDGVPQHAIELHRLWAENRIDAVQVHWRDSPHNIYRPDLENRDRRFLRLIYETRDWPRWDRELGAHEGERFGVRLLHYYTHVSFPLRNDWKSRPLPWWHPEGNYVQESLVIALPSMPDWEDFVDRIPSPEPFYDPPGDRAQAPRRSSFS